MTASLEKFRRPSVVAIADAALLPPTLERAFAQIERVLEPLVTLESSGGASYDETPLTAGIVNRVKHGLGRVPIGWRITRLNAPATIYEDTSTTDETYLDLLTTCDCEISFEVW